jgi:hypothetical protein
VFCREGQPLITNHGGTEARRHGGTEARSEEY